MSNSRYSISKFSIHNTRRDSKAIGNSGNLPSYEQTIGEKVRLLLDKMRKERWVLNEAKSEYLLSVEINSQDEFIFNYMVRMGMNQLEEKSFWFSWPDEFTGNITIHNIAELSDPSKREVFVDNLLSAMNQYIQNISNNWKFTNKYTMASNDHMSIKTKDMICSIAKKLDIEIQAIQGTNFCDWTISGSYENLRLLFDSFTHELMVPQTVTKEDTNRFSYVK